jgi:hypothetical protein
MPYSYEHICTGWRKQLKDDESRYDEEIADSSFFVCYLVNLQQITMTKNKSRKLRWAGNVTCKGKREIGTKFYLENPKE